MDSSNFYYGIINVLLILIRHEFVLILWFSSYALEFKLNHTAFIKYLAKWI